MIRRLALAAPLLAACTAAQSARVLPPGKTQVTVAANVTTMSQAEEGLEGELWFGEVMVRRGLGSRLDGGLLLHRTPGQSGALSLLALEPKVQITAAGARATVSIGLSAGVSFEDAPGQDGLNFEHAGYHVTPALYLGYDLSATAELVASPRLYLLIPDDMGDTETELGGALGVRFTDPARTWAVHPELALSTIEDELFFTLGVSVSAGN